MQYISYLFFRGVVFLFRLLPFSMLYRLSDGLTFLLYYVIRYRKTMVWNNLKRSFPTKTDAELKHIVYEQYRNFSDILFESFKGFSISMEEMISRYVFTNPEVLNNDYTMGGSSILMAAHYSNWEWGATCMGSYYDRIILGFYKPIKNKLIDNYVQTKRSLDKTQLVSIRDTKMVFEKYKNQACAYALVADQNPTSPNSHWIKFLNQDTVCLHGGDKYARQTGYPVFFLDMKRVKRGHYTVAIEYLVKNPLECVEGEITQKFMSRLERKLIEAPNDWLWTHNRWKHKKQAE
ncbi:MAG: hypothetical protein RLZZ628_648 [Bacteroidota bacterium]